MIVGVSGCGKQSLARFAAFIAEYSLFQLEMSRGYGHAEFREDLKRLYHLAGVEGQAVVFLLTDKQLLGDGQVEDVSNMLNSGDVLDLFQVRSCPSPPLPSPRLSQYPYPIFVLFARRLFPRMYMVTYLPSTGKGTTSPLIYPGWEVFMVYVCTGIVLGICRISEFFLILEYSKLNVFRLNVLF
jgi:hypothetical protein